MKKLCTTLFVTLISLTAIAQRVSVNKADKLFQQRAYVEAAEMYRLISDKDQHVLQNLADAYFYTNNMVSAEGNYRELFNRFEGNIAPEYKFRYGQALRAMGKHEDADKYLSEYFGQERDIQSWAKELDSLAPHLYSVRKIGGNEPSSDFGIAYLGNRVVFASTRNEDRPIYTWNNKPYLDLFSATLEENGSLSDVAPLPGDVNTDTHESSPSFNAEGTVMYFDRTNTEKVKAAGERIKVAHISLHRAELVDGKWTNVERLPFTSDQFSTEHPSLSADGTKLYFASDMPGSLGSFDIYEVEVYPDGSFGEPRNLGPNVNTAEREQFPYISDKNVLYFSSNGHMGFGKMDIFRTELEDGEFSKAQNLGYTANSSFDDFAFVLDEGQDKGYMVSTRDGNENMYSYIREENTPPEPVVAEELVEENIVTGAQQLKDVSNIYFEFDSAKILPESTEVLDRVVSIMKEYPKVTIEIGSHSDARGSAEYNMALSQRRAESTMEYLVDQGIDPSRLSSKGYGESMPLNNCGEQCTEEEFADNRRSEFKITN